MKRSWKMDAKRWSLSAYVCVTLSLAVILWGLGLWEAKFIFYGFILTLFQMVWVNLILKHRESKGSLGNYMMAVPTVLWMILMIKNLSVPLALAVLIAVFMFVPIHFLEKYIRHRAVQE